MPRLSHGQIVTGPDDRPTRESTADAGGAPARAAAPVDLRNFDFLFPQLQDDPANLLPESPDTVAALKALAATMVDPNPPGTQDPSGNSPIPAAYTYLGQFIDHDITLEEASAGMPSLLATNLAPLPVAQIRDALKNTRTATLDLDSLYDAPAPRDNARMRIGEVQALPGTTPPFARPPRALDGADFEDLPREPRNADPRLDRAALIGDPRNDENTIISQLHVAFLKAHNRLVDEGRSFDQARAILRQHYQHMVVHDFLTRIADETIVRNVVEQGNRWFNALAEPFFMPFEFTVAGYRFGHTMVRSGYDFNLNFNLSGAQDTFPASLGLLFTFTALTGELGDNDTLPDNWIIEWENIAGDSVSDGGRARRFDTRLAGPKDLSLFRLTDTLGQPEPGLAAMLSARNLLRGYLLRMPTGQAVATALGLSALTEDQLRTAVGTEQADALEAGGFLGRTPLWYYLLAEARAQSHGGAKLGPVGSTLVAEVLVGLVRRSAESVLRIPGWRPVLPAQRPGTFELADLLQFAGVLAGGAPSVYHTVVAGDTLSSIAKSRLGSAGRWPEIFAANRVILTRPDRIFPGQKLALPAGPASVPQLRFHVVAPGDTLSKIAKTALKDATRWPEIFALNGAVLTNPDVIVVGQVLLLPAK